MNKQKNQKNKVFFILGIVFGVLALIGFVGNLIYAISNISYYVGYGYTLSAVLPSYIYQILTPIGTLGGVSAILFALSVIINKGIVSVSEDTEPEMDEEVKEQSAE